MSVHRDRQPSAARRTALLSSAALVALALGGAAHAQSTGNGSGTGVRGAPVAPTAANVAPSAADSTGVGEVIVTAQRRAENLQRIPLSVEAISGATLRNADISDVSRLEQVVPGLRLGRSGAAERPAIRGVYTEATALNSDPRIGFYVDEIYQSRTQQTTAALVDLERVEVQKGPQGTLYGRNSYGGNIALTTATPKDHYEAGLDLTGGNYNRIRAEGYFNAPIAPGLAARVAVEAERHDGYLQSSVNPAADLQDKGEYYVRGSLKWVPPQLDDKLEVLLHASYYNRRDHGFNSVNGKVIGVAEDPSLVVAPGGTVNVNGMNFTFPGGFNGLNSGTGKLYPYTNAARDGVADVNGADIGIRIPGKYQSVYDARPYERLQQQQYSGSISYDLSPWARLRSISSYTKFSTVNGGDGDGTPLPIFYYVNGADSEAYTQEFQLQRNDRKSPLQYTVGGFFLYENDREGSNTYYLNRTYTTATAAARGLPTLYGAGSASNIPGSASSCQFAYATTAACNFTANTGNLYDYPQEDAAKTQSYAAYAQASYKFFDRLTVTGGARYTIDRKSYKQIFQDTTQGTTYVSTYVGPGGGNYYAVAPYYSDSFANLNCGGFTGQNYSTGGSSTPVGRVPNYYVTKCGLRSFEFATYRLAADYELTPNNLVYASFNTGRHSGGFGAGALSANSVNGSFTTFNSEGVEAFEIGTKNQFWDHRVQVNIAAFYNNYTHLQQQGTELAYQNGSSTLSPLSTIFNTGSEHAPGVDFEVVAKPWQALTVNLAVNYLHARYGKYPTFVGPSYICYYLAGGCAGGTFATTAPANYGVGGGYFPNAQTNPAGFVATGISGFNYAYVGADRRVQNTPDWSMQFGASYDFELGRYGRVSPEFHTVWSDDYLLSSSAPNILQNSYFKTDVRVTWLSPNGKLTAQAFVENLESVATLGRITVGASGQVQGTYDDPRTFGVKLGYRFF